MINIIPIVGWLLSFIFTVSLSIPMWLCWSYWGMGAKYFYWLPLIYQYIPFWEMVMLFVCIDILRGTLLPKFGSSVNVK